MNVLKITFGYITLILVLSLMVFLAGLGETARIESVNIVEGNIMNESSLNNTAVWDDYQEFKATYVFSNEPMINLVNFFGSIGLLALVWLGWKEGRDNPPLQINEIFTKQILLLILVLYLGGVIFDYIVNIFVDQLLIVLFNEIYSSIYMYNLIVDWFLGMILFTYFLSWLSNQIKYFNINSP